MEQLSSTDQAARSSAIELRRAADGDLTKVISLLNRAYRGIGGDAGWTSEAGLIEGDRDNEPMLRQDLENKPDARMMVWAPEGKVGGCVWLEPADAENWYLGSFAVDPQIQNKRTGRRLLAAAERFIREQGGRTVEMTVIDRRETLVAWYERRGYRRTGTTVPFPHAQTRFGAPMVDNLRFLVMSKELPDLWVLEDRE